MSRAIYKIIGYNEILVLPLELSEILQKQGMISLAERPKLSDSWCATFEPRAIAPALRTVVFKGELMDCGRFKAVSLIEGDLLAIPDYVYKRFSGWVRADIDGSNSSVCIDEITP